MRLLPFLLCACLGVAHGQEIWRCGNSSYQQEPCKGGVRVDTPREQNVVQAVEVDPYALGPEYRGLGLSPRGYTGYSVGTPFGTFMSDRPLSLGGTSYQGRGTGLTINGVTWRPNGIGVHRVVKR